MAINFTSFKNAGRVAVLAVALGAGSMTAAPVMAQEPSFNFQLDLGGSDSGEPRAQMRRGDHNDFRSCLTDRQIRRGLQNYGFRNIDVRRDIGRNRVEVRAAYGRWTYSMRVNRCTGQVDRVERLRPSFPGGGGGFGLQFNFGN